MINAADKAQEKATIQYFAAGAHTTGAANLVEQLYSCEQWCELSFDLTTVAETTNDNQLVLCPATSPGQLEIDWIGVADRSRSRLVKRFCAENHYTGAFAEGSALRVHPGSKFFLLSTGSEPRVRLDLTGTGLEQQQIELVVVRMRFSRTLELLHRLQHPIMFGPAKAVGPVSEDPTTRSGRPLASHNSVPITGANRPEIVFHIGVQKTATKSTQDLLRTAAQDLRGVGIHFFDIRSDAFSCRQFFRDVRASWGAGGLAGIDSLLDDWRPIWRRFVDSRQYREANKILFSFENIMGEFDLAKNGAIYPHIGDTCRLLSGLFPRYRVKVVVTLRNYADYIESIYSLYVRSGGERHFPDWFASFNCLGLSWKEMVDSLRTHFGRENVFICRHEEFPEGIRSALEKALAVESLRSVRWSQARRLNYALSQQEAAVSIRLASILSEAELKQFRIEFLRSFFKQERPNERRSYLHPDLRKTLESNYQADWLDIQPS